MVTSLWNTYYMPMMGFAPDSFVVQRFPGSDFEEFVSELVKVSP